MLTNFLREYNINRVLLCLLGLWPFQTKHIRNLLWSFYFLLEISYCPFEILLLYDHWNNAQMICESCFQIGVSLQFIMKMANGVWNLKKFRWLYEAMDEHWNIFTNDTEVRFLKDYSLLSRKFAIYYATFMYVMALVYATIPLQPVFLDIIMPLNESRSRFLAFEVEFRVDKDKYYVPLLCYTTAIIVTSTSISTAVDSMHITCIAHACSLFAAIGKQLENIISIANNNNEIRERKDVNMELDPSREEMIYREYIICLKKHQLVTEFVEVLQSSFKEFALIIIMLVVGVLSVIGIRILYVLDNLSELTKFLFILMGELVTLFILCYSGQKLMDESQNIFYKAYATEWYNFSPRLKSLLFITLFRCNVPCGLKAGNMISLSMVTYAAILRTAMSYFTAFLSLQN